MKKSILSLMVSAAVLAVSPAFAMDVGIDDDATFKRGPSGEGLSLKMNYSVFGKKEEMDRIVHEISTNPSLTTLDLSDNYLRDEQIKVIANSLERNRTIKILNLSHNLITNEGIEVLVRTLVRNPTLTSLDLSRNNFDGIGCETLLGLLKENPTLREVNVDNNWGSEYKKAEIFSTLRENKEREEKEPLRQGILLEHFNPEKAKKLIKPLADQGDNCASILLGKIFKRENNLEEAKYYYKLAADRGDKEAQCCLVGIMEKAEKAGKKQFSRGCDLEFSNPEEAKKHLQPLADQGHRGASTVLGDIFCKENKLDEAKYYYKIATDHNMGEHHRWLCRAEKALADLLMKEEKLDEAMHYYFRLLLSSERESGGAWDIQACYGMAVIYLNSGCIDSATRYFKRAGFKSYQQLGNVFFREGNLEESNRYYKLAADSGCTSSQFKLADFFRKEKKFDEAMYYYELIMLTSKKETSYLRHYARCGITSILKKKGNTAGAEKCLRLEFKYRGYSKEELADILR